MREANVASLGKRPTQGPDGTGVTRAPEAPGAEGMLSYGHESGNQALLNLLGRSAIQRKPRVGAADDRFEREADRAADAVVRASYDAGGAGRLSPVPSGMPALQRKCAECEEEEEEVVRRSPRGPVAAGSIDGLATDTAEATVTPAPAQAQGPEAQAPEAAAHAAEGESPAAAPAPSLLVEDSAENVGADQMKKSAFLDALRPAVCDAVDQGLIGTGRSSDGCPHVEFWFTHLAGKDASFIERGIQRFAPGARDVRSAAEYIPAVADRVRQATEVWAVTGRVEGVPEELAGAVAAGGTAPAATVGGGETSHTPVQFKAREGGARPPDSAASVRDQLGAGRPLEGSVRGRMESAYGVSFGNVRIHTDATGAHLSDRLNARAFAVGEHVAFGAGEYRPGTLLGDALIAHELAHVVQQGGGAASVAPMAIDGASRDSRLEADANQGAVGAVAALWGQSMGLLGGVAQHARQRLTSGLRLSRCSRKEPCTQQTTAPTPRKTVTVRHSHLANGGSAADFTRHVAYADKVYDIAGIDVVAGTAENISKTDTEDPKLLGSDGKLDTSGKRPRLPIYTGEEKALFTHNAGGGEVTAYYVKALDNIDTSWALAYRDSDNVVLSAAVTDRVLAHEIGHLLVGSGHPTNEDNIMAQTKVASGIDCLSDDQIEEARDSHLAK